MQERVGEQQAAEAVTFDLWWTARSELERQALIGWGRVELIRDSELVARHYECFPTGSTRRCARS